ncbi:MAG: MmgE/PrpD family protein [Bacillota bacterium]
MYTGALADFCSNLKLSDVPAKVVATARWCVADTLATICGGAMTGEGEQFTRTIRSWGDPAEATVIGSGFKSSVRSAALANGTLCEIIEYQDGYSKGAVHPSSGVIPAALAMTEACGATGAQFLEAVIAGYEVTNRVSASIHPGHLVRGFQPTGAAGAVGAAAAAAKLRGFGPSRMKNALGAAGFMASVSTGDNLWGRYTLKAIHGGLAARCGVESALFAGNDFTACPLEGDPQLGRGFCQVTSDTVNLDRITRGLGVDYTISEVYFKPHPSCRQTHSSIDTALRLATENNIDPGEIESVTIFAGSFPARVPGKVKTTPRSTLVDCQFSIPYCVAVALCDRVMTAEQFSASRRADPKVHALAAKITVTGDEELEKRGGPTTREVKVEVRMRDGQVFKAGTTSPLGDPDNPMTAGQLEAKFMKLMSAGIGEKDSAALLDSIMSIENARMGDIIAKISTMGGTRR